MRPLADGAAMIGLLIYPTVPDQRYWRGHDGADIYYTVVADDLWQAQWVLRESGVELHGELTWGEIPAERAAEIHINDDVREGRFTLNTYEAGSWFCSEY